MRDCTVLPTYFLLAKTQHEGVSLYSLCTDKYAASEAALLKAQIKRKKRTESSSEQGRLIPVWLLRDEGDSQDPIVMTYKLPMSQVCMLGENRIFPEMITLSSEYTFSLFNVFFFDIQPAAPFRKEHQYNNIHLLNDGKAIKSADLFIKLIIS